MIQTIRDWLQQPVLLSQILPYAAIALLLAVVILALARTNRRASAPRPTGAKDRTPRAPALWFGLLRLRPVEGIAISAIFLAVMVLFLMALVAAFLAVGDAIRNGLGDRPAGYAFSIGALLVALLGAPFLIWRTLVAQRTLEATHRQTDLQDEAIFNDKINAAATDLAARRQVTRMIGQGAQQRVLTEWQDDLVTRAAAIDRLEGLATEALARGDFPPAQRIARMLSIYVQELSRAHPAQQPPESASPTELRSWAPGLSAGKRSDMERAVQALGRINPKDEATRAIFDPKNIDLRGCHLQGLRLTGLNFQGTLLAGAQMQGAVLDGSQMQEADLRGAQMQQANLRWVHLQGADLRWAQMESAALGGTEMQGANLFEAQMQGADLWMVKMLGADLSRAQMEGATLVGAQMEGVDLGGAEMSENTILTFANLRGAALRSVDDKTIAKLRPFWEVIFADGTLRGVFPDGELWPEKWAEAPLDADPFYTANSPFYQEWRAFAARLDPPVTIAGD